MLSTTSPKKQIPSNSSHVNNPNKNKMITTQNTAKLFAAVAIAGLVVSTSGGAATIAHSINGETVTSVNLTTEGTQDWKLINFNNTTDAFEIYNSKLGGSGITLGTGFGVDIGNAIDDARGPSFSYTDGVSPVSEGSLQMSVARGATNTFSQILSTYTITFAALAVGVEHTANVYLTTGRATWTDISADWANANPTSLSTTGENLKDTYSLTFTPDAMSDSVTVTFVGALAVEASSSHYRFGFTGATLAVPEPSSSAALLGLGCLALILRRRK